MYLLKKAWNYCCEKARSIGNTVKSTLVAGTAVVATVSAQAQASVPSEITDMTDNASTVWTTVKGIIVGVVGFMILLSFVKLVRKR